MIKWVIIIVIGMLFLNGAINFSTTEEFFTINFHIEKTTELYYTIKNELALFF